MKGTGAQASRSHIITKRGLAFDDFTTPPALAKELVGLVPINAGDVVLDPCRGSGAFFNAFPEDSDRRWCEIKEGKDFLASTGRADWIVSNPPYSILGDFLTHAFKQANRGVGFLLLAHHLTARRIAQAEEAGFGVSRLHVVKVMGWYGFAFFVLWEKGAVHGKVSARVERFNGSPGAWIQRKERKLQPFSSEADRGDA